MWFPLVFFKHINNRCFEVFVFLVQNLCPMRGSFYYLHIFPEYGSYFLLVSNFSLNSGHFLYLANRGFDFLCFLFSSNSCWCFIHLLFVSLDLTGGISRLCSLSSLMFTLFLFYFIFLIISFCLVLFDFIHLISYR